MTIARDALIAAVLVSSCRAPAPAPAAREPDAGWWRDAVVYQVFVRSYADSNGDGIGDLAGLTGRLDHIAALGARGIWLMPIHPSPSYHGYDVTDYRAVHPEYGTLADYDALIRAAEARGIRVIIDLVLNHSSDRHPWFRERPDYYVWRDVAPDWKRVWDGAPVWHAKDGRWYYALFWSGMPDLNLASPAVEAEMVDVMRFWLARGTAGFRVDAARHLIEGEGGEQVDTPESHAVMQRLRAAIAAEHPQALFVAEAWTGVETVAEYREYQLAFSFDLAGAILTAVNDGQRVELVSVLRRSAAAIADRSFEAPFLTNHDMRRVARVLGGDRPRLGLAAAVLHAMPGTPFVYYGEELGMQGGPEKRDEDKRTPMRWTATPPHHGFTTGPRTWYGEAPEAEGVDVETQSSDPRSLLALYRALGALRLKQRALRRGAVELWVPQTPRGVLGILRTAPGGERLLFLANFGAEPTGLFVPPHRGEVRLAEGLTAHPQGLELAARGFAFLEVASAGTPSISRVERVWR